MAKRWKLALLTLFLVFLLTGCVDIDLHLTINKDGTGTFKMKALGKDMAGPMLMESYKESKADLEKQGYKVKTIEENGKQGFEAEKPITLAELQAKAGSKDSNSDDPLDSFLKDFKYTYNKGLFFHTHKVEGVLKSDESAPSDPAERAFLNQINVRLLVTLPTSTDKHNATSVEGNTLIWKLKFDEDNRIYFEASEPNWVTWGILIGILLVVLAIVIWFTLKKKANTPPMLTAGAGGTGATVPVQPTQPTVQPDPSKKQEDFHWDED